jgi:hypothetical protein
VRGKKASKLSQAAVLLILVLAIVGWAGSSTAIQVKPTEVSAFQLSFAPVKPVYKVGESIQFKVSANKDFYLYLFSLDKNNNQGLVLLPNAHQDTSLLAADKEHLIPSGAFEMFSEKSGVENILVVGSTEKLNIPNVI